jgi:hypothetical protein
MKVQFLLWDAIFSIPFNSEEESDKLKAIYDKTHDPIELPYTPQLGMKFNLTDFSEVFGFSEDEQDLISDDYYLFIENIFMNPECIEIYCEKVH